MDFLYLPFWETKLPLKDLNHQVFWPAFLLLALTCAAAISIPEAFLHAAQQLNQWVLDHFDWLFSWSSLSFLILLSWVYFSDFSKQKIGGAAATPLLSKWQWFSITLCSTLASGIIFWGTAEPIYHLHQPPSGLGLSPGSEAASQFAMSSMLMHWTFTPYSIYTLLGLMFALMFYNMQQSFHLGAMLYPLTGRNTHNWMTDSINAICLFTLVAGMSASLGTGILTISGGLHRLLGVHQSTFVWLLITLVTVATFVLSAVTGLLKGIRLLSDFNTKVFILLAVLVALLGPTAGMLVIGGEGVYTYIADFFPRSTQLAGIEAEWEQSWTVFYLANWFAWAPVAALFLGRIARGYTVREFIRFNLLYPALFSAVWMVIFSGTSLYVDLHVPGNPLKQVLNEHGPQNVVFEVMNQLPFGSVLSLVFLLTSFLSFVTAADSNTSAMSGLSAGHISPQQAEAPVGLKILWGCMVGAMAFLMIALAGIDGIKLLSTLGGFPAMLLSLGVFAAFIKLLWRKRRD